VWCGKSVGIDEEEKGPLKSLHDIHVIEATIRRINPLPFYETCQEEPQVLESKKLDLV
jgi:hypothetical protein